LSYVCSNCFAEYDRYTSWCCACNEDSLVILKPRRQRDEALNEFICRPVGPMVKSDWVILKFKSYPKIAWSKGAIIGAWGPQGLGKSTMLFKMAAQAGGRVGLFLPEEGRLKKGKLGLPVGKRIAVTGLNRPGQNVDYLRGGSIADLITWGKKGGEVLLIDSMNYTTFTPLDLERLVDVADLKLLLFTQHATQSGAPKGNSSILHACDIEIHCLDFGKWQVRKNRYGPSMINGRIGLVNVDDFKFDDDEDEDPPERNGPIGLVPNPEVTA